jgi:type I restriction enzyme S subunit
MNCNQAVAIVRLHDGVSKSYVRIWLDSADARHQMGATSVTGTITNLSLSQLGNLQIPEPPQDQLLSFEESSRAINRTIHAFESRANKAQELVNALSARAFRGEL